MGPRSRELLAPLRRCPLGQRGVPVRHLARRSRSAMRSRARTASPTSASSAGRSTCRPTWRGMCSTRSWRAAARSACGSAARTRSTAAAWRRPIATTATTSASTDHVLEAGLGFAVKLDKASGRFGDFIGREGVLQKKQAGPVAPPRAVPARRIREPLLYGNEAILRDGRVVGYLTSGAYGHHLGAAVGLGYVACSPARAPTPCSAPPTRSRWPASA